MLPLAESAGWLFGWLLRNSAQAAILALIVWALERTLLRRLHPRWRYGLWLVVVARLVVPIAPGSAFSLFNLVDLAPASVASVAVQILGLPAPVPVPLTEVPNPLADTPSWFLCALALWLPGAAVLSALVGRDYRRLKRALADTAPVNDVVIGDLLRQSKAVMGVRGSVAVVESPLVTSPAICGCRRPRLLLPAGLIERLTPDEARYLFLHELAHVKRADLALNWVLAAVQILHWFNPVVWLALRRLLNVREEVCDDLVLRRCFPGAARDYGLTLLRLLEECAPRRLVPAFAGILDDLGTLRQRMRCIRTFSASETHPWLPAAITLVLAVAGLTEHKEHHSLFAAAPTPDQIQALAHPSRRSRSHLRDRDRIHPQVERRGESSASNSSSTTMFRALSTALRQAMADVPSALNPRAAGAVNAPLASASLPRLDATGHPGLAGPTKAATPSRVPATASRLGPRPYPLPPVEERLIGLQGTVRLGTRPPPLPPVSQRADAPRAARILGDPESPSPTGRAIEVVPSRQDHDADGSAGASPEGKRARTRA